LYRGFSMACVSRRRAELYAYCKMLRRWGVMVPEHLLCRTHVMSGSVWSLGSVTFISQSSTRGGWLGVSYCSLSCVASCTEGGLNY
jgi:hypothetical protein